MTILVIAEHDHQSLKAATLNTVAAAQKIGGDSPRPRRRQQLRRRRPGTPPSCKASPK